MSRQPQQPKYSLGEEIANGVTHGIGILLALAGLLVMLYFAARYGSARHLVSATVFGLTLLFAYTTSTLYHSIPLPGPKRILRVFDHAAIYLLIAGTYTPFTLVNLSGPWGWSLFGVIWGMAILGIACKILLPARFSRISLLFYIGMGWAVVVATRPMLAHVEIGGLWLLLAGGLAYTGGILFYLLDRLPYNHMIWHLFVLAGSSLHFFAILFYVIPGPPLT